jgi:hypothetical protein
MSFITLQHVHPWQSKFSSSWNDLRIIITIAKFRNVSAAAFCSYSMVVPDIREDRVCCE